MRDFKKFVKGLRLRDNADGPNAIGDLSGSLTAADEGAIYNYQARIKVYIDSLEREIITNDQVQTLENKTLDFTAATGNNTISADASDIDYDDANNALYTLGNDLQTALDAVKTQLNAQNEASELDYDNTTSGLTATNVQAAIDEVEGRVDSAETDIDDLQTLSGVAANSTTLGTFTGATITDNQTVKNALQELETAHEETDANADDLVTLSGVAENSTDLGTFTGSVIADNETVKGALQDLETGLESHTGASTGVHGVTGSVVGTTDAQTLTNKTLTTPVIDEVITSTNADLDLTPNGTGKVVTNKPLQIVQTKEDSTETDSTTTGANATITTPDVGIIRFSNASLTSLDEIGAGVSGQNLTITNATGATVVINDTTGSTAANQIKTGTGASIQLKDEASIDLKYDITEQKWMVIGGTGSGEGGGGGVDVYLTEDFEITTASNLITGNDATFDNGGTAATSPANETVDPIEGTRSISYTQVSGSLNDFFYLPATTVGKQQQGKTNTFLCFNSYTGATGDIDFVVWDDTNDQNLLTEGARKVQSGSTRRTELKYFVPGNCTSIKVGLQVKVENIGAKLIFDLIELNTNPFAFTDINNTEWSEYTPEFTGFGTVSTQNIRWRRDGGDLLIQGKFTSGTTTATEARIGFPGNMVGADFISGVESAGVSGWGTNTAAVYFTTREAGVNYLTVSVQSASSNSLTKQNANAIAGSGEIMSINARVPIQGWANTVEGVLSNSTVGSNWTKYTPGTQGLGTLADDNVYWKRDRGDLLLRGTIDVGTSTAVEARVNFPTEVPNSSTDIDTTEACGTYGRDSNISAGNSGMRVTLIEPNVNYITFGFENVTFSGLTPQNGDTLVSNNRLSFTARIPIEGWDTENSVTILSPLLQTAYIKDVKPTSTAGGTFTAGAWQTRDLNTVSGNSFFVSLNSNQFTIEPGTYEIEADAPAYQVVGHKIKLRNITNSTDDIIGTVEFGSNGELVQTRSFLKDKITITTSTVFEIQHYCTTSKATDGLGVVTSTLLDNIFTQVKITKVK